MGIGPMGHGGRGGACVSGAELTPQGAGGGWVGVLPSSDLGEFGELLPGRDGVVVKGLMSGSGSDWDNVDFS